MKLHEFDLEVDDGVEIETDFGVITITLVEIDAESESTWLEIDGPPGMRLEIGGESRELWGTPSCTGLPRLWLMFSFMLWGNTKRDIFIPAFNEFVEDYVHLRKSHTALWERRWLAVAFTVRSIAMVCACLRLQLISAAVIVGRPHLIAFRWIVSNCLRKCFAVPVVR